MLVALLLISFFNISGAQVYVFESIDNHEKRLTSMESMMANVTSCCSDLRQQNTLLRSQNQDLANMVNNLTQELMSLKQAYSMAIATPVLKTTATTATTTVPTTTTSTPAPTTTPTTKQPTTTVPTVQPTTTTAYPRDCSDAADRGIVTSGIYQIQLPQARKAVRVYCDMQDDGGKWTVIQRRKYGDADFYQTWDAYKRGFGFLDKDFWIGNDLMHLLTLHGNNLLHIKMQDWDGNTAYAEYQDFTVATEVDWYRLHVGQYSGTAGDSFHYLQSTLLKHNNMPFSTFDRDSDRSFQNCALRLHSGWWYNDCYSSDLNGVYNHNGPNGSRALGEISGVPTLSGTGIEWYPWKHKQYSLKMVEMKIRHA